jgi:hypothetical protein
MIHFTPIQVFKYMEPFILILMFTGIMFSTVKVKKDNTVIKSAM